MKVLQEQDRLDARAIIAIVGTVAGLCLLGFGLALALEKWTERRLTRSEVGFDRRAWFEADSIDGQPVDAFERRGPHESSRAAPSVLAQYGWVDRRQGLVHIPIERAKELLLSRERAAAAARPEPATVNEHRTTEVEP